MQLLGMLEADAATAPASKLPEWLVDGEGGDIDQGLVASFDGWLVPRVTVGDQIEQGAALADLISRDGGRTEQVEADRSGTVLMIRRTARIDAGNLTALVGPPLLSFNGAREAALGIHT